MSEHEPGTVPARPGSAPATPVPVVAAPALAVPALAVPVVPVPARAVPAPRTADGLLGLFSPERAAALSAGRRAVEAACGSVFPPRPEDPRGALLPTDLQREANARIATAVRPTTSARDRVWVLEGVVLGFAEQAVAVLAHHDRPDPAGLLRARAATGSASTPDERAGVDAVLALVQACAERDPVAVAWAVECLWSSAHGPDHPPADALGRSPQVRTALSVAASACTASMVLALAG